jgi:hypothetical protein
MAPQFRCNGTRRLAVDWRVTLNSSTFNPQLQTLNGFKQRFRLKARTCHPNNYLHND